MLRIVNHDLRYDNRFQVAPLSLPSAERFSDWKRREGRHLPVDMAGGSEDVVFPVAALTHVCKEEG